MHRFKRAKAVSAILMALVQLFAMIGFVCLGGAWMVGGTDDPQNRTVDSAITNVTILNRDTSKTSISYDSELKISLDFSVGTMTSIPEGTETSVASPTSIELNDYFYITLPASTSENPNDNALLHLTEGTYPLNAPGTSEVVGHFTVQGSEIKVMLDVNDDRIIGQDYVTGNLYLYASMSFSRFEGTKNVTFTFDTSAAASKTTTIIGWPPANPIAKRTGGYTNDGHTYPAFNYANDEIAWVVDINKEQLQDYGPVTIEDLIGQGHEYVAGSLVIQKVTNDGSGHETETDVTDDLDVTTASDSINISLGAQESKDYYRLYYRTKVNDAEGKQTYFYNNATFRSSGGIVKTTGNVSATKEKVRKWGNYIDSDRIEWTVEVDPHNAIGLDGTEISIRDTIGSGHELIKNTLSANKKTSGTNVPLESLSPVFSPDDLVATPTSFTLTFPQPMDETYVVTYTTQVTNVRNPDDGASTGYSNRIDFMQDGSITQTIQPTVVLDKIEKYGTYDDTVTPNVIRWGIDVNKGKKRNLTNLLLKDVIGQAHELDPASVKIYDMEIDPGMLSPLSITPNAAQPQYLEVSLPDSKYYRVTYTTKVTSQIYGDYSNDATFTASGQVPWSYSVVVSNVYGGGSMSGASNRRDLVITKVGNTSPQVKLSGIVFDLLVSDGSGHYEVFKTITTDENGKATVTGLRPRTYYLQEHADSVPSGFKPISSRITVNIPSGSVAPFNQTVTNQPTKVTINKQDSVDASRKVKDAIFDLYDSSDVLKGTYTTGANGQVDILAMPEGTYYLKERALQGYMDNTAAVIPVTITQTNQTVNVSNTPTRLTVYKHDGSLKLAGATFQLRQNMDGGSVVATVTTDSNGLAEFLRVPVGTYRLYETTAPAEYRPVTGYRIVTINDTAASYEDVPNVRLPNDLKIFKKDSVSGQGLANTEFDLMDATGTTVLHSGLKTNASGNLTVTGLLEGHYKLVEKQPTAGYLMPVNPVVDVEITNLLADKAKVVTISNTQTKLTINKRDDDNGISVPGATFKVYDEDKNELNLGMPLITDVNGQIVLTGKLSVGNYFIKEVSPASGYHPGTDFIPFTIASDAVVLNVTNVHLPNALMILKKDVDTLTPLSGAVFDLTKQDGEVVASDIITGADGKAAVSGIPVGHYQLVEKTPPTGYLRISDPIPVTITNLLADKEHVVAISNTQTKLTINKRDNDNSISVPGAVFKVYDEDKNELNLGMPLITDVNGQIVLTGKLSVGNYFIKEVSPASGYHPGTDFIPFTIASEAVVLNVTNVHLPNALKILKKDENTAAPLSGAVFDLTKQNGEVVVSDIVTGADGKATVSGVPVGHYLLVEKTPPTGYLRISDPIPVTITNLLVDRDNVVEISNKRTKVTLYKHYGNLKLKDAEFELQDEHGAKVGGAYKTGEDGLIVVSGLPVGTYQFIETKAPSGYQKLSAPVDFTISDAEIELDVKNVPISRDMNRMLTIQKLVSDDADVGKAFRFELRVNGGAPIPITLASAKSASGATGYNVTLPIGTPFQVSEILNADERVAFDVLVNGIASATYSSTISESGNTVSFLNRRFTVEIDDEAGASTETSDTNANQVPMTADRSALLAMGGALCLLLSALAFYLHRRLFGDHT